jgi:hypothetical protein
MSRERVVQDPEESLNPREGQDSQQGAALECTFVMTCSQGTMNIQWCGGWQKGIPWPP